MAHSLGSVLTYDVLCNQPPLDARAANPNPHPAPDQPAAATPQSTEDATSPATERGAAAGGQSAVQGSAPGSGAGLASGSGLHAEPSLLPLSSADLGLPVIPLHLIRPGSLRYPGQQRFAGLAVAVWWTLAPRIAGVHPRAASPPVSAFSRPCYTHDMHHVRP